MRRLGYILSGLMALLIGGMLSCTTESGIYIPEPEPDRTATLQITAKADGADDPDNQVESIRILVFKPGSDLAYNLKVDPQTAGNPFRIIVMEGTYDFVFILNESSDTYIRPDGETLTKQLDGFTENNASLSDLDDLYFSSSAFANDRPIPMTARYTNVTLTGDHQLSGSDINMEDNSWVVKAVRAGVRVDLFIETTSAEIAGGFTALNLLNVPDKVYLSGKDNVTGANDFESAPRTIGGNDGDRKDAQAPNNGIDYVLTPANLSFEKPAGEENWYWQKRIILPSSLFADKEDPTKAICLQAIVGTDKYELTLYDPTGNDYRARPNYRYVVNARLTQWDGLVDLDTKVVDWSVASQNIIFDGQYFLRLSQQTISLRSKGNTLNLIAETNYDGRYGNAGDPGMELVFHGDWDGSAWTDISLSEPTIEDGIYSYNIEVVIDDLNNDNERWTAFWIKAGNMKYQMDIWQGPYQWLTTDVAEDYEPGGGRQEITLYTGSQKWRISAVDDPDDILIGGEYLVGLKGNKSEEKISFHIKSSAGSSRTATLTFENIGGDNPPMAIEIKTKEMGDSAD